MRQIVTAITVFTAAILTAGDATAQLTFVQKYPGSTVRYTMQPLSTSPQTITIVDFHVNSMVTRTLGSASQPMTLNITHTTDVRSMFQASS
jgi:hypothetical protein